jgi:broad specificity phosphatase PhoE
MKRLLLSRHAESLYNAKGLINADPRRTSSPLTEQGRIQARDLGDSLVSTPLGLCVTSETLRAVETADIALAGRGLSSVKLPLLNDPPAGDFEDGPVAAFAQWMRENSDDAVVPGTDTTIAASAQRFLDAARYLLARHEETVLVVAHAPVLRWLDQTAAGSSGRLDYKHPLFGYAKLFEVSVRALSLGVAHVADDPGVVFRSQPDSSNSSAAKE